MRKLSHSILASFGLIAAFNLAACGDEEGDPDGTGGNGGETTSTGGRTGGGGSDNASGGMGMGGEPIIEPPVECAEYPDHFCIDDCLATGGPGERVLKSGGGAFTDSDDWMEGWTNWSSNSSGFASGKNPKSTMTVEADITEDTTWTSTDVILLRNVVHVLDGVTLTIEPGAVILGESFTKGTLVVSRGGKIMAMGTKEAPIIFTSDLPEGAKGYGQWGGIVMLGRASNFSSANQAIEGLAAAAVNQHGPGGELAANDTTNDDESSGELHYVRIEFCGTEIADGKEVNGLTLGSVGSETKIDHVQVNTTLDDCFEWFGGTVSAEFLVANNCGDDMFDADTGYRGTIENIFGRQGVTVKSDPNGFELDSSLADLLPQTDITVRNATVCGTGRLGNPNFGGVLRENVKATFENVQVMGFDAAFDPRNNGTEDLSVTNTTSWYMIDGPGYTETKDAQTYFNAEETACNSANKAIECCIQRDEEGWLCDDDGGFDEAEWFTSGEGNVDLDAE